MMKRVSLIKQSASKSLLAALLFYGSIQAADLRQQWQSFLIAVETEIQIGSPAYQTDVATFKSMLADLNAVQSLPLWRATAFYQDMRVRGIETMSAQEQQALVQLLVRKYASAYGNNVRTALQQLVTYKNAITRINTQRGAGFTSVAAAQSLWRQIRADVINPLTSSAFIMSYHASPDIVKLVACEVMKSSIDMIDTTIKTLKTSQDISLSDKINEFKIMLGDFHTIFQTWIKQIMPEHMLQYNSMYSWSLNRYCNEVQTLNNNIMNDSNDASMFQRSASFCVNAAMIGSSTDFNRHFPQTAEDMFMLIHQNSLVAVSASFAWIFSRRPLHESIDLPLVLQNAIAYFEGRQCGNIVAQNGYASAPQRMGINYTTDTIEVLYNLSMRNHSSTFQIIYDQRTQQCTMAVQILGEARTTRWAEVSFVAAISKDLSDLDLIADVTFDRNAGIVSFSWIIKPNANLAIIPEYLNVMADLAYQMRVNPQSRFTESMLRKLHRGTASFEDTIQQAKTNYQNRYGISAPWYQGAPQRTFSWW